MPGQLELANRLPELSINSGSNLSPYEEGRCGMRESSDLQSHLLSSVGNPLRLLRLFVKDTSASGLIVLIPPDPPKRRPKKQKMLSHD